MLGIKKLNPTARAIGTVGAVVALVGGVTFAALTSTATLTGNTLSSATPTLEVNNTENGGSPAATDTGYAFSNLIPGAAYGTAHTFTLYNNPGTSTADMDVTVYATIGTPTGSIDKNKVHFKFVDTDEGSVSSEYTLAELEALVRNVPGVSGADTLSIGEEDHFTVQAKLDADAVSGPASVGNFDLVFTGTAE